MGDILLSKKSERFIVAKFFVKFRARGEILDPGRTKNLHFLFETLHQFLVTRSFSVDENLHYHHTC